MEDSWVAIYPGSHYHQACQRHGFCKSGDHLVVSFIAWNKWYNAQRFTTKIVRPPMPTFCGDSHEIAQSVADDLNNWKDNNANISTIC